MNGATANPSPAVSVDFNDTAFSVDDLRGALELGDLSSLSSPSGADSSISADPAEPAGASDNAASPAQVPPTPPTPDLAAEEPPAPAATPDKDDPAAAAAAEDVPVFQFTPDADADTFARERAAWEEAYETDPATRYLIDRQDQIINDLRTQIETVETQEIPQVYSQVVEALDALVGRVQDPRTNEPVANTQPLVEFLRTGFPRELPDVAESLLSLPSAKYDGITLFQEYIRDYGNLDEQGLATVQQIINNGGRLPVPSFVPQGIDPKVAEAFWQAPNRQAIMDAVETQYDILQDPLTSAEDKTAARQYIYQLNQSLGQVQYGLDARAQAQTEAQRQRQQAQLQVQQAGEQAYAETTATLTRSFAERLASNLDMFDAPAARVTALAYGNLIVNALADDAWAPYAQADLAKEGIQFNWNDGKKALQRLQQAEINIAGHVATKASPAAVEIAKKEKAAAIKEVKRLELDLMGKISKVAVLGASKVLEGKAAAAPKTPAARPRVAAVTPGGTNPVPSGERNLAAYDEMTPEELRSRIGQLRAEGGIR